MSYQCGHVAIAEIVTISKLKNERTWCNGVVVITAGQLYSSKPELRFCAGSNPARCV